MAQQRRSVFFSGSVQGVGFRYTACRVAQLFDVGGYVRNLPDGRVECVIEGDLIQIDQYVNELARQMRGYISGQAQETGKLEGKFHGFTVQF